MNATFKIGGDAAINRLGFGAMRITGPGIWGPPADSGVAVEVLKRAVELGVDFIDTADAYGPNVSEDLIRTALHPYKGVLIATKGGLQRSGPNRWEMNGKPDHLRKALDGSLKRLGVDRIDLYQLHRIDPKVPVADQLGTLKELQVAGKIRHFGLSEVDPQEIDAARKVIEIATVQNQYNLVQRKSEKTLEHCEKLGIGFIPWNPIATGQLAQPGGKLDAMAKELKATPAQVALAWLLRRSKVMLAIPGTGSVGHLEENMGAAKVELSDAQFKTLSAMA